MVMKKKLYLLRHAKSSWDDPSLPDRDRPLSKRGRKAVAAVRQLIQSEKIAPELVWLSSARRTAQTLQGLEPWRDPPMVEVKEALYMAPAPKILEMLRSVPDGARSVMLIGHNPGLRDFAVLLFGGDDAAAQNPLAHRMSESFPTGALAEFTLSGTWSEIGAGSAKLARFVVPRELK
jgi:phosphohistidine phosphatase